MSTHGSPFDLAVAAYGRAVAAKLASGIGSPEDQLRGPLETLLEALARLVPVPLTMIGEVHLAADRIRPDFAAEVRGAVVGYIEVKAPGKGADPNRYRDHHDKDQWERLRCLPNVLYTDGQSFGVYRAGERVGEVIDLDGDVTDPSATVQSTFPFQALVADFLGWQPVAPRRAKDLALSAARLCRLLARR